MVLVITQLYMLSRAMLYHVYVNTVHFIFITPMTASIISLIAVQRETASRMLSDRSVLCYRFNNNNYTNPNNI